jgi:hypothetical protein
VEGVGRGIRQGGGVQSFQGCLSDGVASCLGRLGVLRGWQRGNLCVDEEAIL